jgi:FKBP-type peptidyl-prolyl cis-trans isomerase 2
MTQAKDGDMVKVHYTGKLADDTVFDSSLSREPLSFTIGAGEMIPGFEQAVIGMQPGEAKTARVVAGEAYGIYDQDMVLEVSRSQFPANISPQVGQHFQLNRQDGQAMVVTVKDVSQSHVTLDANHPLAGQDLTFDIQLVEIVNS